MNLHTRVMFDIQRVELGQVLKNTDLVIQKHWTF
jgi:hypothetical protein